ncbi:hypothetical protein FRC01_007676 [Tulasnella sp. 417]|nr:hypothetical protein FRC01_007676 [Tulasnella sp. 417]
MDPFAAVPNSNEPAPPPYLSQVEYDEKLADTLQRSLVLEDANARRPTSRQRWSANSPTFQQTARQSPRPLVPPPSSPGTVNTADSRLSALGRAGSSSSHHRQNSISSSSNGTASSYASSRNSKERPAWYNEAGLGGRGSGRMFVSSPATMSNGTSGPSSQPTSPVEEPGYQRPFYPRVLDEEAGIDNPPPSFQTALTAPAPGSLSPARSTPSARSSYDTVTSSSAFPNATSSSTSPRTSYDGHGAPPRLSTPQYPHAGQRAPYSTTGPGSQSEGRRRRGSSAASSSYGMAVGGFAASLSGSGPVPIATNPNGPQLVVDKALAYGKTPNGGLPQGAAAPAPPATAFYGSAVSAILQAQMPNASATAGPSSSSMYSTYSSPSSSQSRPVSQRDSMVSMNTPNSYVVSSSGPGSTSSYTQAEPWRPPSAQSCMTNNSAPCGRTSLGERRMSRESMVTTISAPAFGPRDRPGHGRSTSTAYGGVQMTSIPPARPASSNDQRASYPGYPTSTSSPVRTPPPTDEFNPFAAAGVQAGPTPAAQQRPTSSAYYPVSVSGGPAAVVGTSNTSPSSSTAAGRWMPPGAARPVNLYDKRFT